MLVTFHSDAYENITYFGDVAQQLLKLMGHSGTIPGALTPQELPAALSQLKQGLNGAIDPSSDANDDGQADIGLGKRAVPLINMLEESIKDDCNVLWDA